MKLNLFSVVFLCVCEFTQVTGSDCMTIPSTPNNGNIKYTPELGTGHYSHGTRAEYICYAGYTNDGPQIVIYCHHGEWFGLDNGDPTMCVQASTDDHNQDCQSLEVDGPRENLLQIGSYRAGGHLAFRCVPGYYLYPPRNPQTTNCINGGWTWKKAPYCIKNGITPSPDLDIEELLPTTSSDVEKGHSPSTTSGTPSGLVVGIVVPIVTILGLILVFIVIRYYRGSRTKHNPPPPISNSPLNLPPHQPRPIIDLNDRHYASPNVVLTSNDVILDTPRNEEFGNTYNATIRIEGNRQQNSVARVIQGAFTVEDKEAMEREIDAAFRLPLHYAVIQPIAEINDNDMIGICTEKSPKGSLWSYLHSFRDARNSVKPKTRELINYALQIAEGMKFLHEEDRVCPMLSCHQIMLFRDNICKVPVLGLKHINDNTDLYRFSGDVALPLRWMAPEAINYHLTTKKCDVWAFGVVLYEIVTLGNTPYGDIETEHLPQLLSSGYRLEKPDSCGERLFKIMESCWQQEPMHRPSFEELVKELRELKHDDNVIYFGPDYVEHPSIGNPFTFQ